MGETLLWTFISRTCAESIGLSTAKLQTTVLCRLIRPGFAWNVQFVLMASTRAILFDADGVLIHAERFSVHLQREYGITNDKTHSFFTGVFQRCLVGEANLKEVIEPYVAQWGWRGTVEELLHVWFTSEHTVDEEMVEIIMSLKEFGAKCFLVTNNEKCRTEYMRAQMGFGEIFDEVYSSASVGHLKMDPQFFRIVTDDIRERFLAGLEPQEVAFFDDDQKNIESAGQFGVQAHLFADLSNFKLQLGTLGLKI